MTPDELAENYMAEDYDYWLGLMLDNVPDDIDQREGSVIYDALGSRCYGYGTTVAIIS